jgi:predicted RNase H-like HicB family nuclease
MAVKKKITVVIEKTKDGFSAFAEDHPVYTTGSGIHDLFGNIKEAFILYFDDENFDDTRISYEIDFNQFFKHYRVLNSKALAVRIGMSPTLLSQYVSGRKKPSESQRRRILYGINKIGQELSEMSVVYGRRRLRSEGLT